MKGARWILGLLLGLVILLLAMGLPRSSAGPGLSWIGWSDVTSEHSRFREEVPAGDNRPRMVCDDCGWVHYENPRIIVGVLAEWEGRLLLGRRAIGPREGYWNVPAGFLEMGETPEEGALRELVEETGAQAAIVDLLGLYSVTHIGQVHMIYRGRLLKDQFEAGEETHEARLFERGELPWKELAFPTNRWALEHYLKVEGQRPIAPFATPVDYSPSQLR